MGGGGCFFLLGLAFTVGIGLACLLASLLRGGGE